VTAAAPTASAAPSASTDLLRIADLSVQFGGVTAVESLSVSVPRGELLGLIGPNGAGKTTVFNAISRLVSPSRGTIAFDGENVLRRRPHEVTPLGIGRTFQNLHLFPSLSVLENVMVGAHSTGSASVVTSALGLSTARRDDAALREAAQEAIELVGLGHLASSPATALPYGYQKRVDIARALVARPRLLLLDEPAAGLNEAEVEALLSLLDRVRSEVCPTVLLVEHNMDLVMKSCARIVVLNFGRKIADGSPQEIQANAAVREAYLGS
jgi:branched-chain amino acid transport system ATP-binding protein